MTYGFKLNEFPGNFTVVMALEETANISKLNICPSDFALNDQQESGWIVISPTDDYDPDTLDSLAEEISSRLNCKTIRVRYGDASGHLEYVLFEDGEISESYTYGDDYSDEMREFGKEPREAEANETLIRSGGYEYAYFSKGPHPDETVISGGMDFLNDLFVALEAELSWEYCYK